MQKVAAAGMGNPKERKECPICSKTLYDRSTWNRHMRIHTGKICKKIKQTNQMFGLNRGHLYRKLFCYRIKKICETCRKQRAANSGPSVQNTFFQNKATFSLKSTTTSAKCTQTKHIFIRGLQRSCIAYLSMGWIAIFATAVALFQ